MMIIDRYFQVIFEWFDQWKCQCLMINGIALWLDSHRISEKSMQLTTILISLINLILSIDSIQNKDQVQIYFPVYGHFLLNSVNQLQSYEALKQRCHYFEDLKHIKFVGYNLYHYYYIRIVVMFILFIADVLGLLFSWGHGPCGSKMYFIGLAISLLFVVLFPSQFCINFGSSCIQFSPIFFIYRLQFMVQFNLAWLGIGAVLMIAIIYPIVYFTRKYCNVCRASQIFFDCIYGITCIPFFSIAIVNFIASCFTTAAFLNILTLVSTILNYIMYHSGTDIGKQLKRKQMQVKIQNDLLDQMSIRQSIKSENQSIYLHLELFQNEDLIKQFKNSERLDRMVFYKEWQNRLYREFHQI